MTIFFFADSSKSSKFSKMVSQCFVKFCIVLETCMSMFFSQKCIGTVLIVYIIYLIFIYVQGKNLRSDD